MKNAVVVLANYVDFLEILLDNYPDELLDTDLIVVNETRIGDKTTQIKNLLDKYHIKRYTILTDQDINKEFCKLVDNDFVHDYSMSMNILALWYIMKFMDYDKLFITDEDVIFQKNVSKLFDYNHSLFYHYRLSAGASKFNELSESTKKLFTIFSEIFNFELNADFYENTYLKNYESSGQRLICKSDFKLDEYEKCLIKFFKSDIYEYWQNRRVATSYCLDEKFETFFFLYCTNHELKGKVCLILSKPEKLPLSQIKSYKKYWFLHNATKSHKREIYKLLMNADVIKQNNCV